MGSISNALILGIDPLGSDLCEHDSTMWIEGWLASNDDKVGMEVFEEDVDFGDDEIGQITNWFRTLKDDRSTTKSLY